MELRPLRAGEIIDAAFRAYRARFPACIARSLVICAPTWVALVLLAYTVPEHRDHELFYAQFGLPISAVAWAMTGLQFLALTAVSSWCIGRLSLAYMDQPARDDRVMLRRVPRNKIRRWLLWAVVVVVLGATWFALLGVARATTVQWGWRYLLFPIVAIAGLFATTVTLFAPAVVVSERVSAVRALRRSWMLTRRRRFSVFWVVLLLYIVAITLFATSSALALLLPSETTFAGADAQNLVSVTTTSIVATFLLPMVPATIFGAYMDARVRGEGLDLALALERVGAARKNAVSA